VFDLTERLRDPNGFGGRRSRCVGSAELRMAVVGAPSYLQSHGSPRTPHDLTDHACINIRMQTKGGLYTWEFGRDGRDLNVRVEGPLILNGVPMILAAAAEGIGLACVMEDQAEALLRQASSCGFWRTGARPSPAIISIIPTVANCLPQSRSSSRRFAFEDEANGISARKV